MYNCGKQILSRPEYFGQYGKILKMVVNKDKPFNPRGLNGPTYSAYITFSNDREASLAILAIDGFTLQDNIIKSSYGTTKYCTFFMRDQVCNNSDCLYLHARANIADIITKVGPCDRRSRRTTRRSSRNSTTRCWTTWRRASRRWPH
jgi:CCR4-NOT transcription complex subunit 4